MLNNTDITKLNIAFKANTFVETGLLSQIGNTPLLPLLNIARREGIAENVKILGKAEWFNPGGSVKDRPALSIIRAAQREGHLTQGKRLLDSTSGNMGIAYAMIGAVLNIPITLAIPSNASPERFTILRAFGAELVLTDPMEGSEGARLVAQNMAVRRPETYYYANQYDNPANWQAHVDTTGPEIIRQTNGEITHFVAGLGTSGTFTGISKFLCKYAPNVERVSFEPDSPFHGLEGLKHMPSAVKPGIYDPSYADRTVSVKTEDAYEMTRRLAREEGLFVGISAGAATIAALQVARKLETGVVVTVFPDAGYKYLTDPFWDQRIDRTKA